jgi:cbb3-type cytochrome oxidase maturation protein
MEVLVFLVPLALTLGLLGLVGFIRTLKNGQYDDLEGAGWRAIADDEPASRNPAPDRELMASSLSGDRVETASSNACPESGRPL